jgi:hypothetical protein
VNLQDLGAIGEFVGSIAVVISLIYVAHQIRQSSRQLEQNSRHIEASMYHATNDAFIRWYALLAQDASLAALWRRALADETTLTEEETVRVHSLVAMLFLSYENNFQQFRLGAVKRDTLEISGSNILALMSRPVVQLWWKRQGTRTLTPEFQQAIDSLVAKGRVIKERSGRDATTGTVPISPTTV